MHKRERVSTREHKRNAENIYNEDGSTSNDLKIKKITPKNESQAHYMRKINGTSITFGIGPAGTGKTWIATVMGAQALKNNQTDKLIITRPAVEVGDSLGFLPGELEEKYEPYLRPIRDALVDALGASQTDYFIKTGKIEARPLQFLRGSTLNAWVIADEMQNSTPAEMKMFLSRFGDAKYIINGDLKQKDIPGKSGLLDGLEKLYGLGDVAICKFSRADIVRSGLVRQIIDRYEGEGEDEDFDLEEGLRNYIRK